MNRNNTDRIEWHFVFLALLIAGVVSCGDKEECDTCDDNCNVAEPTLGNVGLKSVWMPEDGAAGMPSELRVTVFADAIKLNTYVRLTLVPENGTVADGFPVAGAMIQQLDPGEEVEVVQPFTLPADLPAGTYTGVFTLNEEDYHPEDDHLQGEAAGDEADNTMVADASMIVVVPDRSVLEVLSTKLDNNSFSFSRHGALSTRDATTLIQAPDLLLHQELVSHVLPITESVNISFSLQIGSDATGLVPLKVLKLVRTGDSTEVQLNDTTSLEPTCRDALGAPVEAGDPGASCATLHVSSAVGGSYNLFVPEEAYALLPLEETSCQLVITVDPDEQLTLYQDERAHLSITLPVQFLPQAPNDPQYANGPETVFFINRARLWGNSSFNAGFMFNAQMMYWTTEWELGGVHFPSAGYFNAMAALPVKAFGVSTNVIAASVSAAFNVDDIVGSYFEYRLDVFGHKIYGQKKYLQGTAGVVNQQVLVDSKDNLGQERFARSVSQDLEYTYWIGPVPVYVAGGATGTIGIKGYASIKPQNVLEVGVGPFAELWLRAAAGIGINGFNVHIGGELLLIRLTQLIRPFLQLQPSFPRAQVGIGFPLIIDTLDGRLYIGYEFGAATGQHNILTWLGLSYEFNFIEPLRYTWGYEDDVSDVQIRTANTNFPSAWCYKRWDDDPSSTRLSHFNFCDATDRFTVYYQGEQFALYEVDTDRYLTYVATPLAGYSHLQLQQVVGDLGPEHLFSEQKTLYRTAGGEWQNVSYVKTHNDKYWGCGACGTCENLDVVNNPPQTPCNGGCCVRSMFLLDWGPRSEPGQ